FLPYLALLRQRRPREVIVTAIFEGFFFFGAGAFLGAFLHDRFEIGYAWVGLMLACFGAGSLIYSRTAGPIIQTLGERGLVNDGSGAMSCCYLALAFAPNWQTCVPILMICGFGFYLLHNTLQTLATELAPDARGTAVSLFAFSLIIGQGAGVAFLGSIIDRYGYTPAFVLVSIAVICLGMWFQDRLKVVPPVAVSP
ncbi:MAG: MFS transporter, partial [Proteobacteria bacterium]|nr:MFS transporter [Pseudomonadota bacterium]